MSRLHPYHPTEVAEAGSVSTGKLGGNRFVEEISAYAAKKKKRAERRNAAPETVGPTPERLAKAGSYEEILVPIKDGQTRAGDRATRLLSVYDEHKARLPEELSSALQAVLDDFSKALIMSGALVSSYGEGGGSAPGPRHGGVPDYAREAAARIDALGARFGARVLKMFIAYVVDVANETRRRANISPWTDKATNKGVSYGYDLGTLEVLGILALHNQTIERAFNGRVQSTGAEIKARLQVKREQQWKRGAR